MGPLSTFSDKENEAQRCQKIGPIHLAYECQTQGLNLDLSDTEVHVYSFGKENIYNARLVCTRYDIPCGKTG